MNPEQAFDAWWKSINNVDTRSGITTLSLKALSEVAFLAGYDVAKKRQ